MPEIPNVVVSEDIEVEWGNAIRDRVLQRYEDSSTRASESPTPGSGELSYLEDSGDVAVYHSGSWRKLVPSGVVFPYAGSSIPPGYLLCNGAEVSRSTYAALFAAIGTTFGAGDGSTTFNIPEMRQRFPLGVAASGTGNALGDSGGDIDHVHSGPSHTHGVGSYATASAGSHDHPAASASAGSHDHPAASASGGSHSHSFSDTTSTSAVTQAVGSGAAVAVSDTGHTHSVSGSTSSAGGHTHAIDTDAGGAHTHAIDTDSAGAHTHSISGSSAAGGTGATGSANPPFLALHYIIRT